MPNALLCLAYFHVLDGDHLDSYDSYIYIKVWSFSYAMNNKVLSSIGISNGFRNS